LNDIIAELEDNFRTASAPTSGLPAISAYLPPSTAAWKAARSELSFLDAGVFIDLKAIYEQIDRWQKIVASGINPGLGSLEIPQITSTLRIRLPELIGRLRPKV